MSGESQYTNGSRMTNAERNIERLRDDIGSLHKKLESKFDSTDLKFDAIMQALSELKQHQAVDDVTNNAKIESIQDKLCPDPGLCKKLEPRVEALEIRSNKWHDSEQQFRGALKTVRTFWLGVGALLTTFGWILKEFFTKHN